MFRITYFLILFLLLGCGGGNLEKNLERMDKSFGKCDNPNRHMSDIEYKICKDKELTQNDAPDFNLTELMEKVRSGNAGNASYTGYNQTLWKSALETVNSYSLKITDSQGGYIETDWIYSQEERNKRCLIKIQITSAELVSNGVISNLVCEIKDSDENWYPDGLDHLEESKQLTLSILKNTQNNLIN
jgi:hypothetical protein